MRYDAALEAMHAEGLTDDDTVFDIGSGMGEFGARLHTGREESGGYYDPCVAAPLDYVPRLRSITPSRARYVPVDAAIDGTDLDRWTPPRDAEWFCALELLEHLERPYRLIQVMQASATKGVVVSTPNPETTDVLGMDATHLTPIDRPLLERAGFVVSERSFYGAEADSLFGVWLKEGAHGA